METVYTIQQLAYDFFRIYYIQILTLICVLYLMLSGTLKQIINRILRARRLKAGSVEIEYGENETSHPCEKPSLCSSHSEIMTETKNQKAEIEKLIVKTDNLQEHVDEIWIDQLKLVFYNKDMPEAERMIAGLRYIRHGRNGDMRKDVIQMIQDYPEIYEIVKKLKPQYELKNMEAE
jgi:hypothetical protein